MAIDMNMNILIVDDQKTMLRIIDSLLRQIGFTNITQATGGQQAIDLTKENSYGLPV